MQKHALLALALLAMPLFAGAAEALENKTYVSASGNDANPCDRGNPCRTFPSAVSKTSTGGEINCLEPGDFGAVTITRSLTIDCRGTRRAGIQVTSGAGVTVTAGQVTLRGFEISGLGAGSIGLNITGSATVTADTLKIFGFATAGVRLNASGAVIVTNSRVENNGVGIDLNGAAGANAAIIRKSEITSNTGDGIKAQSSGAKAAVSISDSLVALNGGAGVNASGNGATAILGTSTVTGNVTGVASSGGGAVYSFKNNDISGNTSDGTPIASAVPTVSSVSPNSGPQSGGTAVTITGLNLTGTAAVTFGGAAATAVSVVNNTTVTATTPAHAPGTVDVQVTNATGTGTGSGLFTYLVVPPTVSSVSPNSGPATGGTAVTISGAYFTSTTGLTFGGTPASFTLVNDTTITATTPPHKSGAVDIKVTSAGGTGTGAGLFTYQPAPTGANLVSSLLPTSRSVQVGKTATAFYVIINAGGTAGAACGLSLGTSIPATFSYQTTNPSTNAVTGTPNTSANIAANGGSQTYVFAVTPTAPFAPADVPVIAQCDNNPAAPVWPGINTILLSASATPVPDIIALAVTLDGIVNLSGANATGAIAVASVNVGAPAAITVSADTGGAALPVTLTVCQTDPATAACTSAIGPSVTTTINTGATPTFSAFASVNGSASASGNGRVPFDPVNNRIYIRFKDADGVTRGSTSVAVRTQ